MTRIMPVVVLLSLSLAPAARAQVAGSQTPGRPAPAPRAGADAPKTGAAVIRGRVVDAETGRPVRRAMVRLTASIPGGGPIEPRQTGTDDQGRYEFKELPASRYSLWANKTGYVQLYYGQVRPFESGRPIELLDAQILERMDFSLPHAGAVTGRIVDEYGDPVPNIAVTAYRSSWARGRRELLQAGSTGFTDDTGEYRISGLPPGQFTISAKTRAVGAMMAPDADDRMGYAETFFPRTTIADEARRVSVGLGQTIADISIAVIPARMARVSGAALDSKGKPLAGNLSISQSFGGGGMSMSMGSGVRPDGTFTLNNVQPGEYTLRVQSGTPLDGGIRETASMKITVGDKDIDDLRLVAEPAGTIAGRILVEPGAEATVRPTQFRLSASLDDAPMLGGGTGVVNDDLTFELKTAPGRNILRATSMVPGLVLKAVRVNGTDVTDSGFDVKSAEEIRGVEIEMTARPSSISGVVTNDRGEPALDYTAVVFARDEPRWKPPSRYIASARPDAEGRFKIPSLPEGDYYIIALDYVEPGQWTDPEFLQSIRARATSLTLGNSEAKTVNMKVTARP